MPLPLGHTMVGWTIFELLGRGSARPGWKTILFIAVLSNLPDLDIAAGLLASGNGCAFHRGFTHSLAFALMAGSVAANVWRFWPALPRMPFTTSSLVVLSHTLCDLLLTRSPVSLAWPLETHRSGGVSGWGESLMPILFEAHKDAWVALACLLTVILVRIAAALRERAPSDC